jgi:tetratricopeptide (TPR) repeat protein
MPDVKDSNTMPQKQMEEADAHALLRKELNGSRPVDIAELATTLDHIPQALVQAAAYIRQLGDGFSVQQYLTKYRQSRWEANQRCQGQAAGNSVFITCQISVKRIWKTRSSAANLLSLMSFFDPREIPSSLLRHQHYTETEREIADRTKEDVLTLQTYSLIATTTDAKTFTMHNQVQLATQKWLEHTGQLEKWRAQFISSLCAELPTGQYENWERCRILFPHAQAALAQRPYDKDSLKKWARLLYKSAWYAWQIGRAEDAEGMSVESMKARVEVFGDEHVETLSSMGMVGLAMALAGKFEEAANMHRQTLAQTETTLGLEHPDILPSMNNLALVLNSQGKYRAAEALNRTTLERTAKLLRHKHPDTLLSMHNLATVLTNQGKYKEAEAMHRETLKQFEDVLGPDHPHTIMSMNNLASVLDRQDKFKEAEALYRWTVGQREKLLGHEHPSTLASMTNLATVLGNQGRYKEAEAMTEEALERKMDALGLNHPDTLMSMNNLAVVQANQGRYNEAEAMHRNTLKQFEDVLGPDHPHTIMSMNNLASVLDRQDKCNGAEALYRRTLAQRQKLLGHEHPSTLVSMSNLTAFLDNQAMCEEVEDLKMKGVLRPAPPDPLVSVNCLTRLFTSRHHYDHQYAKRSAHCKAIAGGIGPNTCLHYRHHADVLAALAEGDRGVHKGMGLKLLRRIAETVTRRLKLTAG